jgi:hypothetical protein
MRFMPVETLEQVIAVALADAGVPDTGLAAASKG